MKNSRPNILIINPDQMRHDYMTPSGHPFISTGGLSRLAEQGTTFTNAFCSCPMCGPSRTSFMTGRYPNWHGVLNYGGTLDLGTPNALTQLREAGYHLAIFGKDHIFRGNPVGSIYHEGDEFCLGNLDSHPAYNRAWDCAVIEKGSQWDSTGRIASGALDFLAGIHQNDKPFFLTLNFQDPHPLFCCPEPYASMFDPEDFELPPNFRRVPVAGEPKRLSLWREHSCAAEASETDIKRAMSFYCGQIRYVDDQVSKVMDTLKKQGLSDNTIILFWSDHGEYLGDFGVTHKQLAFYECLVKIPAIISDPTGCIGVGRCDEMTEAMDLMASILDICGVKQPEGSLANSLLRKDFQPRHDVMACGGLKYRQPENPLQGVILKAPHAPSQFGPGAMLRTRDWKLAVYADGDDELYDLANDPFETCNLCFQPEYALRRQEMLTRLTQRLLCDGMEPERLYSMSAYQQ